jgi:hypothetical protein
MNRPQPEPQNLVHVAADETVVKSDRLLGLGDKMAAPSAGGHCGFGPEWAEFVGKIEQTVAAHNAPEPDPTGFSAEPDWVTQFATKSYQYVRPEDKSFIRYRTMGKVPFLAAAEENSHVPKGVYAIINVLPQ